MFVLAACSSGGSDKKSSDTTTTKKESSKPTASGEPTTDLADGATVTVNVKGFTAGKYLGINECAQTGTAEVGQDDCDLAGIKTITVGSDGTGTGTTVVKKSAIGKNAHVCGGDTRCFLSVGELVDSPDVERAEDVNITFAG
jgi:hypothetical protein